MKHSLLGAVAALTLIACGNSNSHSHSEDRTVVTQNGEMTAETVINGDTTLKLTIKDAHIMPPLKGRDVGAGFFTIENAGETINLVSASSPIAQSVEVHTHLMEDGIMKMREVDAVELPSGASVDFEPGGYHLMMFGFDRAEGQSEAPVTLTLDSGETLTLTMEIRDR